jgi:hypothetical protein
MLRTLFSVAVVSLMIAGCEEPASPNGGGNGGNPGGHGGSPGANFDPCDQVDLQVGDLCSVAFEVDAAYGMEWRLQLGYDEGVITNRHEDQLPFTHGMDSSNSMSLQVFDFEVVGPGSTTIEFWYMDLSGTSPEEVWSETITIAL